MMYLKNVVLATIRNMEAEQESSAYFELICNEVFGGLTDESEVELKKILSELESEKQIVINGDRISSISKISKGNLLILENEINYSEKFKSAGLEVRSDKIDVGQGCNLRAEVIEFIQNNPWLIIVTAIKVGTKLKDIKDALEGFNWFKDKVKEVLGDTKPKVYYSEEMLVAMAVNNIIEKYRGICIDTIQLKDSVKTKIGSLGYYAIQNYGYSKKSLEGSPESIYYFVFEISSEQLQSDWEVVTCQVLSTGEVTMCNNIPVSTGPNLRNMN